MMRTTRRARFSPRSQRRVVKMLDQVMQARTQQEQDRVARVVRSRRRSSAPPEVSTAEAWPPVSPWPLATPHPDEPRRPRDVQEIHNEDIEEVLIASRSWTPEERAAWELEQQLET